jgi:hypothetical protein
MPSRAVPIAVFPHRNRLKLLVFAVLATNCLAHAHAQTPADHDPEPNPARPTVSSPATLTPVGYLQFENGTVLAKDSPEFASRAGIDLVTKLTVVPRLELLLETELFVHSRTGPRAEQHEGEVFAGFQSVVVRGNDSRPTISVSYMRRLHESPAPELDIGTFRQSALLLLSHTKGRFHLDANGIISEQAQAGVRRAQYGQTLSISRPVKKLTVSAEIWHFSQPFLRSDALGNLWAVSYPLHRNLIVDVGFDHGLTHTSTKWEALAGFTYLLPRRLWRTR